MSTIRLVGEEKRKRGSYALLLYSPILRLRGREVIGRLSLSGAGERKGKKERRVKVLVSLSGSPRGKRREKMKIGSFDHRKRKRERP